MFPVGSQVAIFGVIGVVLLGMAMGLAAGAVFSLALGLRVSGLLKDALLGAAGFVVAQLVFARVNDPDSTEVAFFLTLLFPLIRQLWRLRQQDSASPKY